MEVHVRDLRYFVAVAEELSFTRAAQRVYVSQPALSKQIKVLEGQLGTPLFQRDRSGVHLTEGGLTLLPYALRVLAAWDEARVALRQRIAAEARTLRVGFTLSVGRGLLSSAMTAFGSRHPGWRLDLHQSGFADPTSGLLEGHVDVALVALPMDEEGVDHEVLITEDRHVALPIDHPLTALDVVPFEALIDEPFLALPAQTGKKRNFWLGNDARGGRAARIGAVVNGPEEAIEALGAGLGVSLISSGNAKLYQRPEFTTRPVSGLEPCHFAIAWRHDDRRAIVRDFVGSVALAVGTRGQDS